MDFRGDITASGDVELQPEVRRIPHEDGKLLGYDRPQPHHRSDDSVLGSLDTQNEPTLAESELRRVEEHDSRGCPSRGSMPNAAMAAR